MRTRAISIWKNPMMTRVYNIWYRGFVPHSSDYLLRVSSLHFIRQCTKDLLTVLLRWEIASQILMQSWCSKMEERTQKRVKNWICLTDTQQIASMMSDAIALMPLVPFTPNHQLRNDKHGPALLILFVNTAVVPSPPPSTCDGPNQLQLKLTSIQEMFNHTISSSINTK